MPLQGDLQEDDMMRLAGALGRSQHETFKQQSYDTTKTYIRIVSNNFQLMDG